MNRFKILLALLALFVVLTAPTYFEDPAPEATRGTFARGDIAIGGEYARGAYVAMSVVDGAPA